MKNIVILLLLIASVAFGYHYGDKLGGGIDNPTIIKSATTCTTQHGKYTYFKLNMQQNGSVAFTCKYGDKNDYAYKSTDPLMSMALTDMDEYYTRTRRAKIITILNSSTYKKLHSIECSKTLDTVNLKRGSYLVQVDADYATFTSPQITSENIVVDNNIKTGDSTENSLLEEIKNMKNFIDGYPNVVLLLELIMGPILFTLLIIFWVSRKKKNSEEENQNSESKEETDEKTNHTV